MKVFSLNTWLVPFTSQDRVERREKIAKYILKNNFDVITLQEVWLTKDVHYFVQALQKYKYCGQEHFFLNPSGLVTFFKGDLIHTHRKTLPLPPMPNISAHFVKKGFLHTQISCSGKIFDIVNTHFQDYNNYKSPENCAHLSSLQKRFKDSKRVILAGDFNVDKQFIQENKTFPFAPKQNTYCMKNPYAQDIVRDIQFDYVFFKGLRAKRSQVVKQIFSDHYGIAVDLEYQ